MGVLSVSCYSQRFIFIEPNNTVGRRVGVRKRGGGEGVKANVPRVLELKRNLKHDARATSEFQQMAGLFQVGGGQRRYIYRVSVAVPTCSPGLRVPPPEPVNLLLSGLSSAALTLESASSLACVTSHRLLTSSLPDHSTALSFPWS